uniref:Uncharacterized protein n=1 Tax=Anguilla anguilla TaxID=7936 RepID=A0A0E9X5S3_ANGAN
MYSTVLFVCINCCHCNGYFSHIGVALSTRTGNFYHFFVAWSKCISPCLTPGERGRPDFM